MEGLLTVISAIADLPPEQLRKFEAMLVEQHLVKGEHFVSAGSTPQKFAFVNTGLFRYFYANEKGKDFTKGFFPENTFISSYSAMITQTGSHYTIEALEDSHIFVIDFLQWQKLYNEHPGWSKILIAMLQKGFMKKERRERELLLDDAETRYKSFLKEYPLLQNRIKQHQIASYLGITPVALSRIRKAMS
jgi:CRP-like cAMP-binding protein